MATSNQASAATVGTGYNTTAITKEKLITLTKKNPDLAGFVASVFGVGVDVINSANAAAGTVNAGAQQLDRYTKNVIQTLFSAENYLNNLAGGAAGTISGSIGKLSNSITVGIGNLKGDLNELLKPVSAFTGSTLGTLANVLRDPLGAPFAIAEGLGHIMDKVNPGFTNRLNGTLKKLNVDNLRNLPDQIIGSARNLVSMVDQLLAIPFGIAADLYNGLMEIMKSISELIDSVISAIFDFFFGPGGILDSIFPISAILEVLQAIGEFSAMFGQISSMFGGFAMVDNIVGQINGFASQAAGILSNPAQLAMSFIPPEVGGVLSSLRNPDQFLSSIIPPQVSGLLGQIGQVSGLGFSSNLGYGLGGVLETMKNGVLTQVFDQYVGQIGILAPYLGKAGVGSGPGNTQQNYNPAIQASPINGQPVVQGVPIDLSPRPDILQSSQSQVA